MPRLARSPLLHFLLLGGLAFLVVPEAKPVLQVDPDAVARTFAAEAGRPPTPAELERNVEREIDARVLEAEAWRRGLDRHDSAVATRLARIGDFVDPDAPASERAARVRAIGADRSDPVLRAYLAERMRKLLLEDVEAEAASDAVLAVHLAAHPERFARTERLVVEHVFRRGPGSPEADDAFAERLAGLTPAEAARHADPFPLPSRIAGSRAEIERELGPGATRGLDPGALERWQGPLRGTLGRHWMWVSAYDPPHAPTLEAVRAEVEADWRAARRGAHLARRLAELRERYEVRRAERIAATSASGTSSGIGASSPQSRQIDLPSSTVRR